MVGPISLNQSYLALTERILHVLFGSFRLTCDFSNVLGDMTDTQDIRTRAKLPEFYSFTPSYSSNPLHIRNKWTQSVETGLFSLTRPRCTLPKLSQFGETRLQSIEMRRM